MTSPTSDGTPNTDDLKGDDLKAGDGNVVEMSSSSRASESSSTQASPSDFSSEPSHESSPAPRAASKGSSRLPLFLGLLLLISIAANVYQSRQLAQLGTQSAESEVALDRAIERIDQESIRAERAESTITAIDGGIDVVNERITELQSALKGLSALTDR